VTEELCFLKTNMKKNIYLLLVSLLMLNTAIGFSQKNIILDTDFGGDADAGEIIGVQIVELWRNRQL